MARKKGYTPQQRTTIIDTARMLIREGTSRRKMDTILRRQFGVSISRDAFTSLYRSRRAVTERIQPGQPQVSRAKHPIRSERDRYEELIRRGFIHEEAREFMKAHSLKYHEFRRMSMSRRLLLRNFTRRTRLEPGDPKFVSTWREYIHDWYRRMGLTTFDVKLRRVISPWDWFDRVSYRLPPEMRYSKKGRRKNVPHRTGQETASMRAFRLRAINQLKDTLARNPARKAELEEKIKKLGGKVK